MGTRGLVKVFDEYTYLQTLYVLKDIIKKEFGDKE